MLPEYARAAIDYLFAPEDRPRAAEILRGTDEQVRLAALLLGWRDLDRVAHWVAAASTDSRPVLEVACWGHTDDLTREEIDRRVAELSAGVGRPALQLTSVRTHGPPRGVIVVPEPPPPPAPPPPPGPGPRTVRVWISGVDDEDAVYLAWDRDSGDLLIEEHYTYNAFDGEYASGVRRWPATEHPEHVRETDRAKIQALVEEFRRDPLSLLDRANVAGRSC